MLPRPSSRTSSRRSVHLPTAKAHFLRQGPEDGALPVGDLAKWSTELEQDRLARAMGTILSRTDMQIVLTDRMTEVIDQQVFNIQVSEEGTPVANQLRSGRCWLFAVTNLIRTFVIKKYKLKEFQLSQSYLSFYDHLSKVNWFLESMLDMADCPLDDRTVASILASGIADGGQYTMAVNLINTFGLVPQTVYPESWNSSHSHALNTFLSSKCREYALELRKAYEAVRARGGHQDAIAGARKLKEQQVKEIYRVLCTLCGTPPLCDEPFVWEFRDKDGRFRSFKVTPLEFARDCGYNYTDTISLINDPRHPFGHIYTVEHLGNVVGGPAIRYCNVASDVLKQAAIRALKADCPVWFGCDVNKVSNTHEGVMDLNLYHYDDALGTKVKMTKKERLVSGDSSMTHAMMLTGVHLDTNGRSIRWRVENSWGPDACTKGFLVMSDDWFDEFVYQVVVPDRFVAPDLVDLFIHGVACELPFYDPMGTLAM